MYKIKLTKYYKQYLLAIISLILGLISLYMEIIKDMIDKGDLILPALLILMSVIIFFQTTTKVLKLQRLMKTGTLYRNIPFEYSDEIKGKYNVRRFKIVHILLPSTNYTAPEPEEEVLFGDSINVKKIKELKGTTNVLIDLKDRKNYYVGDEIEEVI